MSMVGAFARTRTRSPLREYLAQYIFSMLSVRAFRSRILRIRASSYTARSLSGKGRRARPRHYYAVQVKSTMDPWTFESEESLLWLIRQPVTIFLCVIDKNRGRVRVFQTMPRYYLWAHGRLPARLELIPEDTNEGRAMQWDGGERFSLSAPILDFTFDRTLRDDFPEWASHILTQWIEIDGKNLARIRTNLPVFSMPSEYRTNEELHPGLWIRQFQSNPPGGVRDAAILSLMPTLRWLVCIMMSSGQPGMALRVALLARHLCGGEPEELAGVLIEVNKLVAPEGENVYRGIDRLNAAINDLLPEAWRTEFR